MPRKNNREQYEPADVSNFDGSRPGQRIGTPWTPFSETAQRKRQGELFERRRRQEEARQNRAIDWAICLVPGCGQEPSQLKRLANADSRDHNLELPLCVHHISAVIAQASFRKDDPIVIAAVADVVERREARELTQREAAKKAWLTKVDGHIYYVRLNGLIKVGWSRDIHDRIRSYGPSVEVLVVYPGTRHDETNLHRQLKPARARGHEWYEDGKILADFIAAEIKRHGQPAQTFDSWTRPTDIIAGKRHRRSA